MAIAKQITFEGLIYNLDDRDRVAARAAQIATETVTSITDSPYSVTAAQSGTIFTLNRAAGIVVTLPSAAVGLRYEFFVETALTSNNYSVVAASSADVLSGIIQAWDIADIGTATLMNEAVATTGWMQPAAADYQLITNKTTTGGLKGSHWKFTCITDAIWQVSGINMVSSGASIATPFDGA